jgi:hypothetical protein
MSPSNRLSVRRAHIPGPRVCLVKKPHPVYVYPKTKAKKISRFKPLVQIKVP